MGLPPTGKQVAVPGVEIDRISGGKIVESWTLFDQLGMLRQLGAVPPVGQPAAAAR
jgi:predicted ester cyclase